MAAIQRCTCNHANMHSKRVHTHIPTHINTYIHTHIHTYMCRAYAAMAAIQRWERRKSHSRIPSPRRETARLIPVQLRMDAGMYVCMYVYVCVCVSISVLVCMWNMSAVKECAVDSAKCGLCQLAYVCVKHVPACAHAQIVSCQPPTGSLKNTYISRCLHAYNHARTLTYAHFYTHAHIHTENEMPAIHGGVTSNKAMHANVTTRTNHNGSSPPSTAAASGVYDVPPNSPYHKSDTLSPRSVQSPHAGTGQIHDPLRAYGPPRPLQPAVLRDDNATGKEEGNSMPLGVPLFGVLPRNEDIFAPTTQCGVLGDDDDDGRGDDGGVGNAGRDVHDSHASSIHVLSRTGNESMHGDEAAQRRPIEVENGVTRDLLDTSLRGVYVCMYACAHVWVCMRW